VREYSAKDIQDYVEANRELLMVEAILKVRREPSLLRVAESESRRRARQRPKPMDPAKAQKILDRALKR
jgi:hypothetical protein